MPRSVPVLKELRIDKVDAVHKTSKGNCYLECTTTVGTVAFWGSAKNMSNINLIQRQSPPFAVQCGCIPSNWPRHKFWIPESSRVSVLTECAENALPPVSADELARWRRVLIHLVEQLESPRAQQQAGLKSRIGQLSRNGALPREVASMMGLVAEMRNVAEYESKLLSGSESEAVRSAWKAILEWARSRGLAIKE
jgi:hypothetical protein